MEVLAENEFADVEAVHDHRLVRQHGVDAVEREAQKQRNVETGTIVCADGLPLNLPAAGDDDSARCAGCPSPR
jgi:hypothetical protein